MIQKAKTWACVGGIALWCSAVGGGTAWMMRYSGTPGEAAVPSTQWPVAWEVRPAPSGITLLLTIHSECPCSRATLDELAKLLAKASGSVRTIVLMNTPIDLGAPSSLRSPIDQPALWKHAAAIPGVQVIEDFAGKISSQLGSRTSGQTFAFDSTGKLHFSGGITPARGHMGDSVGGDSLAAILTGGIAAQVKAGNAPVFGCPLRSETTR